MTRVVILMPRSYVSLEVPPPDEDFAAELASVRGLAVRVESHVFVQVARVAERPHAKFALQRLVPRVRSAKMKKKKLLSFSYLLFCRHLHRQ